MPSFIHSYRPKLVFPRPQSPSSSGVPPRYQAIRFGRYLSPAALDAFQPVMENMACLKPYGPIDFRISYQALPERTKHLMGRFENSITPSDLKRFAQEQSLGLVEESSDLLLEIDSTLALQQKLFTPSQLTAWQKLRIQNQQNGLPFFAFFHEILKSLKPEQCRAFQKMTGLNIVQSRLRLALIGCKSTYFDEQDPNFNSLTFARQQILSEAREIAVFMPKLSLSRLKLWAYSLAAVYMPGWISKESRQRTGLLNILLGFASRQLHLPLSHPDLMRYSFLKQLGRQEMNYHLPLPAKDESADFRTSVLSRFRKVKKTVKPFELLYEASILKAAECRRTDSQAAAQSSSMRS